MKNTQFKAKIIELCNQEATIEDATELDYKYQEWLIKTDRFDTDKNLDYFISINQYSLN